MSFVRLLQVFSLILVMAVRSVSQHTFSICAVDTATGNVGSAGASCIPNSVIISDMHPGRGVIHTQALWSSLNQNTGRALMNAGWTPQEIIDSLVAGDFVMGALIRQYGVAGIYNGLPLTAAFTGDSCLDYKNHIIGPFYTIQGNILQGQHILDSMEARFLRAEGDLACRLMAALQGAKVVGADTRCTASGNSSLSAFLRVAKPSDAPDSPFININVPSGPPGFEPIDSLQKLFDALQSCLQDTTTGNRTLDKSQWGVKIIAHRGEGKISIAGQLPPNAWLEIYDSTGRVIFSGIIDSREIHTGILPAGVCFWQIWHGGKIVMNGKTTVQ